MKLYLFIYVRINLEYIFFLNKEFRRQIFLIGVNFYYCKAMKYKDVLF